MVNNIFIHHKEICVLNMKDNRIILICIMKFSNRKTYTLFTFFGK